MRLLVHDVRGTLVQGWEADLPAGIHDVVWDLRSLSGRPVPTGIYFVRLAAGGESRARTLVVAARN